MKRFRQCGNTAWRRKNCQITSAEAVLTKDTKHRHSKLTNTEAERSVHKKVKIAWDSGGFTVFHRSFGWDLIWQNRWFICFGAEISSWTNREVWAAVSQTFNTMYLYIFCILLTLFFIQTVFVNQHSGTFWHSAAVRLNTVFQQGHSEVKKILKLNECAATFSSVTIESGRQPVTSTLIWCRVECRDGCFTSDRIKERGGGGLSALPWLYLKPAVSPWSINWAASKKTSEKLQRPVEHFSVEGQMCD